MKNTISNSLVALGACALFSGNASAQGDPLEGATEIKNGTYNNGLPAGHCSTAYFANLRHFFR